jgi:hypothetical protein
MLFAHQRALTAVRGAGNAGLPETFRLEKATMALLSYDLAEIARAGGMTCPHAGVRCECIGCIDFGCLATETPDGQQVLDA